MKKIFGSLILLLTTAAFAKPGDYQDTMRTKIRAGLEACQLQYISGQDYRLPYQIAARNVDEVVVRLSPSGAVIPGVLIDMRTTQYGITLQYTQTNGGNLLQINRDFNFNDISIDTARRGRLAFSNTYWYGQTIVTDFVLQDRGARYVGEAEFYQNVDGIVQQFVDYICSAR